ncbi:MAG: hypothetical protein HKN92_02685 [Chitinophagales bacterium]|nr:hypothetical protein [Chitinophagales bacterium]
MEETLKELKEEKERGRLYWFMRNSSRALWSWMKKHWILSILIFLVFIYLGITGRAIYQPFLLNLRKYFVLTIIVVVVIYWLMRIFFNSRIVGKLVSAIVLIAFVFMSVTLGQRVYEYLGLYIHYISLNKVELTELPTTDHERIHPLNSIQTLARQEALSETEEATRPMFIRRRDGSFDFSMSIGPSPEYPAQRLEKNMYRVISVSATTPAPDFSKKNQYDANFDVGPFLLFSKNINTASIKSFNFFQFFNYEIGEPFFLEDNSGNWVQVVPLIRWKGVLIPRPVFGGVLVFHQIESTGISRYLRRIFTGVGDFIPSNKIESFSYLKGQHLLPIKVARFIAESFRFQEGFFAPMPGYHEGDIRIPDMPQDQNEQPFFTYFNIPARGGILCSYFGLEPYQETKKGLNTSLIIPGDSDNEVFFKDHSEQRDGLIGSSAVPSKVIESKKNYDWSKNHPAESRPYIKEIGGKNRFFWLNTVVTNMDDTGTDFIGGTIPDVTITDAKYGRVVWIEQKNLTSQGQWKEQISEELNSIWEQRN